MGRHARIAPERAAQVKLTEPYTLAQIVKRHIFRIVPGQIGNRERNLPARRRGTHTVREMQQKLGEHHPGEQNLLCPRRVGARACTTENRTDILRLPRGGINTCESKRPGSGVRPEQVGLGKIPACRGERVVLSDETNVFGQQQ